MPRRNRKRQHSESPPRPLNKRYPTTVNEKGEELIHMNQLPGQKPVLARAINPFSYEEKQARIYVFGFDLNLEVGHFLSEETFKEILHRYTSCEGFFRSKASRAKRNRGQSAVSSVQVHRRLVPFGAKVSTLIRPAVFPDTNLHKIQQIYNTTILKKFAVSLWLFDHQLENFSSEGKDLELTIKVMQYENAKYQTSDWNEALPTYDTVEEYRESIGVTSFRGFLEYKSEEKIGKFRFRAVQTRAKSSFGVEIT